MRQRNLAYNDLALLAMRRFQHTDAITLLNHAIEAEVELEMRYSDHHPDHRFYINRGDCFMALGRTELATADFSIAYASAPLDSTVTTRISMMHYNLAIPLFNGGDFPVPRLNSPWQLNIVPKLHNTMHVVVRLLITSTNLIRHVSTFVWP